jgi:hypothetical protein
MLEIWITSIGSQEKYDRATCYRIGRFVFWYADVLPRVPRRPLSRRRKCGLCESAITVENSHLSETDADFFWPGYVRVTLAILDACSMRAVLTQQELAKQLGKPQPFVSQYENGQRRVDVVEFVAISDTLGIRAVDLFSEIPNAIT